MINISMPNKSAGGHGDTPLPDMKKQRLLPTVRNLWWTRLLCLCLAFLIVGWGVFIPFPRRGETRDISFQEIDAKAVVLMEFSRGEIVYARGEDEPLPPASLTKVMTLLLAYEALEEGRVHWDDEVTISEKAWQTGGSQMYLDVNQVVTFGELLTGIATISANDACVAVAEYLSGSEDNFVAEMNRKAQELGLTNTLFQNTSGLPHEDHYSSALDMARIAHYYINRFPEALTLHSQKEYTFNEILQYNRNPLLGRFPGADGLKTGHTTAAGYCLVATAQQNGMRFIAVVMNSETSATRLRDSDILLNYAFRNYTLHSVFNAGDTAAVVEVKGGILQETEVLVEEAVEVVIPFHRQDDLLIKLNYPETLTAPLTQHEIIGSAEIYLDDLRLSETSLVTADDVEKAGFFELRWRSLKGFITNMWSRFLEWLGGFFG